MLSPSQDHQEGTPKYKSDPPQIKCFILSPLTNNSSADLFYLSALSLTHTQFLTATSYIKKKFWDLAKKVHKNQFQLWDKQAELLWSVTRKDIKGKGRFTLFPMVLQFLRAQTFSYWDNRKYKYLYLCERILESNEHNGSNYRTRRDIFL